MTGELDANYATARDDPSMWPQRAKQQAWARDGLGHIRTRNA